MTTVKVNEVFLTEEELYEISLRHAIAAGTLGASLMGSPKHTGHEAPVPQQQVQQEPKTLELPAMQIHKAAPKQQQMAEQIADKYRIDIDDALEIVMIAHKYEKPNFPKAKDILAIIGVESSFDPSAVSGLRRDPAVGLMQVRPKVWNMTAADLEGNVEKQIATGADILHLYYKKLRSRDAAVAAYNVGMSEFRSGNSNEGFVAKYLRELGDYTGI